MRKVKLLVLFALLSAAATAKDVETIVSGTISIDSTFTLDKSPYLIASSLIVDQGVTLTIESGVTVKVADNVSINISGTLTANNAIITSNNASPVAGSWSNINVGLLNAVTGQLNLTNTTIEYANTIDIRQGNATISGSTLQNFSTHGLTLSSINTSLTINSSTIASTTYPLWLDAQVPITVTTPNTFSNNSNNFAYLNFENITDDWTMTPLSIPYKPKYSLTINAGKTLTTPAGTSLAFDAGRSLTVLGTLIGNAATFTSSSLSPSFGSWNYLEVGNDIDTGAINLTNCTIEYAKYLNIKKGSATLTNTDLNDFLQHGVYTNPSTTLSMSGGNITTTSSTAYDGNYYAIYVNSNTTANLENVNMSGYHYGLYLLSSSSTATLNGCTLSALATPLYFKEAATLTVNTPNTFTENQYNHAWVYFSELESDWEVPTLSVPYDFNHGFKIKAGANFTTNSNNIFKIKDGYAFDVYGTLTAVANADENIYFTSYTDDNWGGDSNGDAANTAAARYSWIGLRFYNTEASASILEGCQVRFTGHSHYSYDYGSVTCYNSSPTINNCEFSNNKYGLTLSGASKPSVSNTIFASSSQTPIAMSFEADPIFNNNTLSFSDNTYDAIGLLGGTLSADATIRKRNFTNIENITYYMLNSITIPDTITLNITPGVVVKAHNGREINVYGTLNANGTSDEHIVFTSGSDDNFGNPGDTNKDGTQATPAVGHIGGINFHNSANDTSSVSFCEFRYTNGCAIYTQDASPIIDNNSIIQTTDGVKLYGESNPILTNNSFVNISNIPVTISSAANPTFSGNTFSNVGLSALGLQGGDVTQSGTISKKNLAGYENITYVLTATMTIKEGTYVNIEPGVVVKLSDYNDQIIVEGGFKAQGSEEEKIIFTSFKDDNIGNPKDANGDGNASAPSQDNWNNIYFKASSDDNYCLIENVDLLYSGSSTNYYNYNNAAIEINNANPTIKKTLLFQTGGYGISIQGNSTPTIDSVTIQNSSWDPIGMSLLSNPQFSNMNFIANRSQGLAIIDATLASDATLEKRDVAGIENIAYILNSSLTVASNSTLSITPGVVIKPSGYGIYIRGALIANGTPEEKITITSFSDDSRGGDTNNNGNNSSPGKGNWSGIYFYASGLDSLNSLKHVDLRYVGNALSFENCKATIDSCIIEQVSSYAATLNGSASPIISNCQMMNCKGFHIPGIGESVFRNNQLLNITGAPVRLSTFTKAKFENNSMANVTIQAIELLAETYSKSDTIPFRNFAGHDSITYYLASNTFTINNGTELTIPAGMVFKGEHQYQNVFTINGKLTILGTLSEPTIFTDIEDDSCGSPLDTKRNGKVSISKNAYCWFRFNNVSDDESSINYAEIRYISDAINVYSASPNINNCLIENCTRGIYCNGIAMPKLRNNTFHNLSTVPFSISLVAYPSVLENNLISGSTYKMIEVNGETLSQDVTLTKRNFAGITNIPYYFPSSYTVGSGTILSIEPGVVCKLANTIYVKKGLIAKGGSTPDSTIIFTSIGDDFYGGDSNSDGESSSKGSWYGINFSNTCIETECQLSNTVIKNIHDRAIYTNSTNPTIKNSLFENINYDVIRAEGASQPIIDSCDFVNAPSSYSNNYFAINNVHKTFTIGAPNCWWGNATGPEHSSNPDGTGARISDDVSYSPFVTRVNMPQLGDVSRNSAIQAYDASLVLLATVGDTTLDTKQQNVANVSGNTGENAISAYDASLILQKVVGIISYFGETPIETKSSTISSLSIIDSYSKNNGEVSVPIEVSGLSNTYALQTQIQFDEALLSYQGIERTPFTDGVNIVENQVTNTINISIAGASALPNSGTIVNLKFKVETALSGNTELKASKFIVNEEDRTAFVSAGHILYDTPTEIAKSEVTKKTLLKTYPNPFNQALCIDYKLSSASEVSIDIYSLYGQHLKTLVKADHSAGKHTIEWLGDDASGNRLAIGMYFIRLSDGTNTQTIKVQKY